MLGGGQDVLTGGSGVSPSVMIDSSVASLTLESTGGDAIRLAIIQLGVFSSVPEPGSLSVLVAMIIGTSLVRLRRWHR